MTRMEFPVSVKKAAAARANGFCDICKLPIQGRPEFDHILPDGLGGKPEQSNCAVLCRKCHRAKTKRDNARMSKADRIKSKNNGTRFTRTSQPMPGTRASGIRKRMNGTVERF